MYIEQVGGGWLKRAYYGFVQGENFLRHFLLLILRVYWGTLLISTAVGKFGNIHGVAEFFGTLTIPKPLASAYLVAVVELIGGLSLFFGCLTRFFTILLSILFVVAYSTAHHEAVSAFFSKPSLFVQQDPFLYLLTSLIVLCFGPGLFSFDYWLEKKTFGKAL